MKFIKLHKTHFMAMVYKDASVNMNDYDDKLMNLWSKSKLQYAKINKNIKMEMTLDKSNNVVRNKPLKPNVLYRKQLTPYKSATAKYVYKKRPSDRSDKKKPHVLRNTKK